MKWSLNLSFANDSRTSLVIMKSNWLMKANSERYRWNPLWYVWSLLGQGQIDNLTFQSCYVWFFGELCMSYSIGWTCYIQQWLSNLFKNVQKYILDNNFRFGINQIPPGDWTRASSMEIRYSQQNTTEIEVVLITPKRK